MSVKTSIRYFNDIPVRACWDQNTSSWRYSAVDIIYVLTGSNNPRKYWNTFKTRNPEMTTFCGQLKLKAADGKYYLSDVIDESGVNTLLLLIPSKHKKAFSGWIKGLSSPLDEQSKKRAYELFQSDMLNSIEVGTTKGLKQIHSYLFGGLYDFAGQIRERNISKGGFIFANCNYLTDILKDIDNMNDNTLEEIVEKYVSMNIAHPFMEGNGRTTRIWLDMMLKTKLGVCVDWSLIDKKDYLNAMELSPVDASTIYNLIKGALTKETGNRELFMKGIDYSYYYEEIE